MSEEQTSLTHEELNIWDAIDGGDGELLLKLLEEFHATGRQLTPDGVWKMASKIADLTRKRGRGRPKEKRSIFDDFVIGEWIDNRAPELKGDEGGAKTLAKIDAETHFGKGSKAIELAYTNWLSYRCWLKKEGLEYHPPTDWFEEDTS
ncbi:MAG: hypothetical protein HN394_21170 [Rhodospirillaceae bacterium]|jgi:hypothetical protein|nr:hypothetical protein [Rhodospirillaceae bacterium]